MAGLNGARAVPLAKGPWRGPRGKLPVGEGPGLKLTVEPSPCHEITLAGYRKLLKRSSVFVSPAVNFSTLFVSGKGFKSLVLVVIDLPKTRVHDALFGIFHKAQDVANWIPQEQSYFVGKRAIGLKVFCKLCDASVCVRYRVSFFPKDPAGFFIGQISFKE